MLRITSATREGRTAILLEGRLAGRWVEEVERAYPSTIPPPVLDLSGVTFADARGIAALRRLRGHRAELIGASSFIKELLRAQD